MSAAQLAITFGVRVGYTILTMISLELFSFFFFLFLCVISFSKMLNSEDFKDGTFLIL